MWTPPSGSTKLQRGDIANRREAASTEGVYIVSVDLAKRTFQIHGARSDGFVAFRKKLMREEFLAFLGEQPACIVAMEACATAHLGEILREELENKKEALRLALIKGEESGRATPFDFDAFIACKKSS